MGTKTERTPANYLQLYLAYAQAVSAGNDEECRRILGSLSLSHEGHRRGGMRETPLEIDIRAVLNGWGYQVERGVGDTGFSLDLGVLHSDTRQGYILGIECDGGAHFSGRSARIREVWRPGLLEFRGWKIHRVWSDSWWLNRDAEIHRLKTVLEAVRVGGGAIYGLAR